jgi:hypothetical protein
MGVSRAQSSAAARNAILELRSSPSYRAVAVGIVLGAASLYAYSSDGYGRTMRWLWIAAVLTLVVGFAVRSKTWPRISLLDVAVPAGVVAALAPLYLLFLYRWPVQINSDEIAIMNVSDDYSDRPGEDPFGISYYLSRPKLLFMAWGRLGNAIGGIDLFHMRLLHALVGLLVIAASYALFRQLLPARWAAFAAFALGVSHSMFMISRLAMRENTCVLVLVVGLAFLLWGFRNEQPLFIFLGGFVAGLGYYVYQPARITFPLWMLFLVVTAAVLRSRFGLRRLLATGAIAAAGFILMAGPIINAESKLTATDVKPDKQTLLVYKEARVIQQGWVGAPSESAGYWKNVRNGLGAFNNRVVDNSYIYPNYGHGFSDPLTGILVWLGAGVVLAALVKRRRREGALLMLTSFVFLWLALAFLINKAPNYTRLLITLPFVAYFVTEAVRWLAGRYQAYKYGPAAIVATAIVALTAWNLAIARDFLQVGRHDGNDLGSTLRLIDSREDIPGESFYLVRPYFSYEPGPPEDRLKRFADDPNQVKPTVEASALTNFQAAAPFTLFMQRSLWRSASAQLADQFPRGRIRNVTADGRWIALEVPS